MKEIPITCIALIRSEDRRRMFSEPTVAFKDFTWRGDLPTGGANMWLKELGSYVQVVSSGHGPDLHPNSNKLKWNVFFAVTREQFQTLLGHGWKVD